MSILESEVRQARVESVVVTGDTLKVDLTDGRTVSVPLAWYPRLVYGTVAERNQWELLGDGEGIHWPSLDEDISVAGILLGRSSAESQRSLQRWLEKRKSSARQAQPQTNTAPQQDLVPQLAS